MLCGSTEHLWLDNCVPGSAERSRWLRLSGEQGRMALKTGTMWEMWHAWEFSPEDSPCSVNIVPCSNPYQLPAKLHTLAPVSSYCESSGCACTDSHIIWAWWYYCAERDSKVHFWMCIFIFFLQIQKWPDMYTQLHDCIYMLICAIFCVCIWSPQFQVSICMYCM